MTPRFPPLTAPESHRSPMQLRTLPMPSLPWGELIVLLTLFAMVKLV